MILERKGPGPYFLCCLQGLPSWSYMLVSSLLWHESAWDGVCPFSTLLWKSCSLCLQQLRWRPAQRHWRLPPGGCTQPPSAAGAAVRLPPAPLGNCSRFPRDADGWLMWVQKSVPFGQNGTDSTVLLTLRVPCRIRPGTDSTEATPCSAPSPLLAWPPCCLSLLSWELSFNKPLAQESPSGLEGGQVWFKVLSYRRNVISYISLSTSSSD